jgi:fucose 4-O-acetylase-like acetyltransferase
LALLVVFGHALSWFPPNDQSRGEGASVLWRIIYSFHLSGFFALSGYLAGLKEAEAANKLGYSILKRSLSLLVPTAAVCVVPFVINVRKSGNFFAEIFLVAHHYAWFTVALAVIAAASLLLNYFIKRRFRIVRVIVPIVLTFAVSLYKANLAWLISYWVIYEAAAIIATLKPGVKMNVAAILTGLIYLLVLPVYLRAGWSYLEWRTNITLGLSFSIAFLVLLPKVKFRKTDGAIVLIGKHSIQIYLLHALLNSLSGFKFNVYNPIVTIAILMVIDTFMPIGISQIMETRKWSDFIFHPMKYIKLKNNDLTTEAFSDRI